jgi:small GTP-binding protein
VTVAEERQKLVGRINKIKAAVAKEVPALKTESFDYLIEDMMNAIFTVVVVGEFKRGKSTFVNSLLRKNILPADVTPTTACIHTITYGEEKGVIFYKDGSQKEFPVGSEVLDGFTADGENEAEDVNYIGLSVESPLLRNRVALVDTPGIDDINEQRSDITYQFIPRADAVFFLLDITSPVKQTEFTFLKDTLLEQGKENIIFLANFVDRMDEEEEEEALETVRRRLASSGIKNANVWPLSAKMALLGRLKNDEEMVHLSGIEPVEKEMVRLIDEGTTGDAALKRYRKRFDQLNRDLGTALDFQMEIEKTSVEKAESQLEAVNEAMDSIEEVKSDMRTYVEDKKQEITMIVSKSLTYMEEQLTEDVQSIISRYEGLNFEKLIQEEIPGLVKRRLKMWIEQYVRQIHYLFEVLEKQIAIGLAAEFNAKVEKIYVRRESLTSNNDVNVSGVSADDLSNTPVLAGMMAGGAGSLALLLGGPLLIPIIGMAGFPIIQKYLSESKSRKVKLEITPVVMEQVEKTLHAFSSEVLAYVDNGVKKITVAAEERMEEVTSERVKQLEEKIQTGITDSEKTLERVEAIERARSVLREIQEGPGHEKEMLVEGRNR